MIFMYLLVLIPVAVALYLLWKIADSTYMAVVKKPPFLHYYNTLYTVSPTATQLLIQYFPFYNRLDDKHKEYFRHRLKVFFNTYTFAGRDIEVTEEMQTLIGATWVMLTFGMRNYLSDLFTTVIVYPQAFTGFDNEERNCEFNPNVKVVVFSWPYFKNGIEINNDNFNPGIYQFCRIMHMNYRLNDESDATASLYTTRYEKLLDYLSNSRNRARIVEAGYFKEDSFYNNEQFLAVAMQYFFETPQEFKRNLHGLYKKIALLINYND